MNEEIDLYADVDKVHSSDFQEVHQTREPISKLVRSQAFDSRWKLTGKFLGFNLHWQFDMVDKWLRYWTAY